MTKLSSGHTMIRVLAVFLFLFALFGCGNNRVKKDEIIPAFKISVSTGGGFTGLRTGYHIYSSGKIEYWQRFPAGADSILWTNNGDVKEIVLYKKWLDESELLQTELNKHGNMTTYVGYAKGESEYSWSFNEMKPDTDLEKQLKKWCQNVVSFCKTNKSN